MIAKPAGRNKGTGIEVHRGSEVLELVTKSVKEGGFPEDHIVQEYIDRHNPDPNANPEPKP